MEDIILNNISDSVYVVDPGTYRLLYVNRKLATERGLTGEDDTGGGNDVICWRVMYPDLTAPCSFCPRNMLLANSETPVYGEFFNHVTGRYYRNTSRIIELADGRQVQLMHSVDITEIREQLARVENAKSDYMSRMSHEILTPMNAIVGMSKIAGATGDMAKIKNCLLKIDEASKQLLGIINSILDISRLEADRLQLVYGNVRLEPMLIEVCAEAMARANEKGQDFQVVIDRDVPQSFRTDGQRLSQVVLHLLLNAVKFTPVGGKINLHASLKSRNERNADIMFTVTDNGVGISRGHMEKLFEAFEQADGTRTRAYGGIGLGLAIARRLVRLLGGDIVAESEPGKGSTFTMNIIVDMAEDDIGRLKIRKPAGMELNILYADDSEEARDYFGMLMREYRTPYKCVEDGFTALDSIERAIKSQNPYSIVFVDLRMPHLNGIETIRQIRNKFGNNPAAVLMAGVEWDMIEQTAEEAGIRYFLSKPLFPSKIVDIINQVIGLPEEHNSGAGADGDIPESDGGLDEPALPDFSSKRILLIDDIRMNHDIIEAYLKPTGVMLDYAYSGVDAVAKFSNNPEAYDIVLMDLHMPEMDGCETAINIRSLEGVGGRSVPIIALTAEILEKEITRCRQSGMNGYLQKPVSRERLFDKLADYFLRSGVNAGWADINDGFDLNSIHREGGFATGFGGAYAGNAAAGAAGGAADGVAAGLPGDNINVATEPFIKIINTGDEANRTYGAPSVGGRRCKTDSDNITTGMYDGFLPVFDVSTALLKLRNIKKLYIAMLQTVRHNPLFNEMRGAMANGDFSQIGNTARLFINVAQNLCLKEMLDVLIQIETMARHRVMRPGMMEKFENASERIMEKLDDLMAALNREAED
jgi:signal transduction histidine kinase/DNA-binding response OmpR family regulator